MTGKRLTDKETSPYTLQPTVFRGRNCLQIGWVEDLEETDGTYQGATFDEFVQIIETCTKQNRNLIWGEICPKHACYNGEICKEKKPFIHTGLTALFEYLQELKAYKDAAVVLYEEQEALLEIGLTELCCIFIESENLKQFNEDNGSEYAEYDQLEKILIRIQMVGKVGMVISLKRSTGIVDHIVAFQLAGWFVHINKNR